MKKIVFYLLMLASLYLWLLFFCEKNKLLEIEDFNVGLTSALISGLGGVVEFLLG